MPEITSVRTELTKFVEAFGSEVPREASASLSRFTQSPAFQTKTNEASGLTLVVPLAILRAEFEYLIRDQKMEARNLTELAFVHLQRMIEMDADVQKQWNDALSKHETQCERLGAVHLLSHGIWAFKVSGIGAATDLVFDEPIERYTAELQRTARALVVTEWKLVKTASACDKAAEGRKQAKLYQQGVLADMALTSTRFVVLVSGRTLPPIEDVIDDGVTYRHIIIATMPNSPSKEARSRKIR